MKVRHTFDCVRRRH